MIEESVDEPDTTVVTEFVYDSDNCEQKSWKLCNDVSVARSEADFFHRWLYL